MDGAPLGRYVFIYAIFAWVFAALPLIIHMATSLTKLGQAWIWTIYIHEGIWWPVALTHLGLSLYDSFFMRRAF